MFGSALVESRQRTVPLAQVDAEGLAMVLDYMYLGPDALQITPENLQDLWQVAHMYLIESVAEACAQAAQELAWDSPLEALRLGLRFSHVTAIEQALCCLPADFVESADFVQKVHDPEMVARILQHALLPERTMLRQLRAWLAHAPDARLAAVEQLLPHVRLAAFTSDELGKLAKDPMLAPCHEMLETAQACQQSWVACQQMLQKQPAWGTLRLALEWPPREPPFTCLATLFRRSPGAGRHAGQLLLARCVPRVARLDVVASVQLPGELGCSNVVVVQTGQGRPLAFHPALGSSLTVWELGQPQRAAGRQDGVMGEYPWTIPCHRLCHATFDATMLFTRNAAICALGETIYLSLHCYRTGSTNALFMFSPDSLQLMHVSDHPSTTGAAAMAAHDRQLYFMG